MADLAALRDQFAAAFEAGDSPDIREWLGRVDDSERQELEALIDHYLMTAPRRAWDPDAFERSLSKVAVDRVFDSREGVSGSWPALLPQLRDRARILRRDLVLRLADDLGVGTDDAALERVGGYYNGMEHGQLEASGVSDRVLDSLARLLDSSLETLRAAGRGMTDPADLPDEVFARLTEPDADYEIRPMAAAAFNDVPAGADSAGGQASPGQHDRIDELFTGG